MYLVCKCHHVMKVTSISMLRCAQIVIFFTCECLHCYCYMYKKGGSCVALVLSIAGSLTEV